MKSSSVAMLFLGSLLVGISGECSGPLEHFSQWPSLPLYGPVSGAPALGFRSPLRLPSQILHLLPSFLPPSRLLRRLFHPLHLWILLPAQLPRRNSKHSSTVSKGLSSVAFMSVCVVAQIGGADDKTTPEFK